MNITEQLG